MMGAGIAYVCAKAGIEVVLKDVSLEAAEKGKAYSEKLLAKQVQKGRTIRRPRWRRSSAGSRRPRTRTTWPGATW